MAYTVPTLGYAFDALEPFIDALTMEIHHDRHHAAYVTNLNAALETHPELQGKSLEELLSDIEALPTDIKMAVRNNGGGHWNHSFFWEVLQNNNGATLEGKLSDAINTAFGSFDAFKEQFSKAGMTRFGSGWAWLIVKEDGSLAITSTPNQDNPLMSVAEVKGTPILGVDVWEHAYYLKYQNKRADYLAGFWNVVNWGKVAELLG
jgi:superoxide dismutase, Fe-Mn family